ncbi:MAG TPA: DUF4242 domain-containing protein [Puia sp.]|nr:DUF4242 domain-containing protein [Puia sp.]
MKKIRKQIALAVAGLFLIAFATAQTTEAGNVKSTASDGMHTYVIERNIPGAGQFSPEKLKSISQTSCTVLKEMGPDIQWLHSYVTADKIFCVYKAKNMDLIREHAKRGGFPVNAIYEVDDVISPATAQ